jgi:hypothetical protein
MIESLCILATRFHNRQEIRRFGVSRVTDIYSSVMTETERIETVIRWLKLLM